MTIGAPKPFVMPQSSVAVDCVVFGVAEQSLKILLIERGAEPFEAFVDLLAELYPLVHARLTVERHTDFGVLYRWAGSGGAADTRGRLVDGADGVGAG